MTFMNIYNLNDNNEDMMFESYRWNLKAAGKITRSMYDLVWSEIMDDIDDIHAFLERQFARFNIDRPEQFKAHSMSVSDVIEISTDDSVTAYYVDMIGFQEIAGWDDEIIDLESNDWDAIEEYAEQCADEIYAGSDTDWR